MISENIISIALEMNNLVDQGVNSVLFSAKIFI